MSALLDPQRLAEYRANDDARFKVPPLGKGQIEYLWSADCEVDIVCHLEYTPAEEAQHYGDAPYPGSPEDMSLCAAYLRGVDILALLSDTQINWIEEHALIEMAEEAS